VYKPLSEIDPRAESMLQTPTPAWLDREYPYVAPPDEGCTLKELDYLISLVPLRDQWGAFIKAADENMSGLFVNLCSELGAPCDENALSQMASEAAVLITKLKWLYNRPRPYQVAAKHGIGFTPMGSVTAHTPAYPSGHTIQAYLISSRLSEVSPQHRKAFMDLAHAISFSRAVGGYHWPSDLTFGKDVFRHVVMPHMPSSIRVAAKYKNKKEVPKADGSGTTTVYEYSPRQVAQRHKQKAVRIESLRKKMGDLRKQALSDLTASDPETRLTALAVCLMDETYERVGNEKSAKEGHHGVTNWTAGHVTLSDKSATIKYTGKSGVKHEKKVTNARVLSALRKALKGKSGEDKILCDGEECSILAKDVNAYLKPYEITAKDIRGLHANEEMKRHLKAQRKAGPSDLPRSRKERDKILKAEFKAALDLAAAAVGHEASTLRSQYLVPSMEKSYVHDGTVLDQLDKKATLSDSEREDREDARQVRRSPKKKPPRTDKERRVVNDRDNTERDPDEDQDQKDRSTNFKDAALRVALMYVARGSTTNRQKRRQKKKKDRERRVKKERNVRRNNTVRVRKKDTGKIVDVAEETLQERGGEYEQITDSPEADAPEEETPTEQTTEEETPAPAGDKPSLRKFPTEPSEQAALYDQVSGVRNEIKQITDDDPSLWDLDELKRLYGEEFKAITGQEADSEILDQITAKTEDGQDVVTDQKSLSKVLQKLRQGHAKPYAFYKKQEKAFRDGVMEGVPQQYRKSVSGFSAEELVELDAKITEAQGKINLATTSAGRVALRDKAKRAEKKLKEAENLTPEKAAKYLVTIQMAGMLDDPDMVTPGKPLSKLTLEKKPAEEVQQMVADRTTSSLSAYRAMSAEDRKTQKALLEERLEDLNDDGHGESEQYAGTLAALRGLALASLIDEDKAPPEAKTLQAILRAADEDGSLYEVIQEDFMSIHENEDAQGRIRNLLEKADNLTSFLPDDHPTKVLTEFLGDEKNLKGISKDKIEGLRQQAMDQIMAEVMGGVSTKAPAPKTSPESKPSSGGKAKKTDWLARAEAIRKRMLAQLEKLIQTSKGRGKSASLINAWDFTSWDSCR
jgi:DNA topoisomerase-1